MLGSLLARKKKENTLKNLQHETTKGGEKYSIYFR